MRHAIRRHPYLVLLNAAVAVHALAAVTVFARYGRIDHFAFQSLDAYEYYNLARNLLERHEFTQEPEHLASPWTTALKEWEAEAPPLANAAPPSPTSPDTWRTPGYPVFLALIMAVLGTSAPALILGQQCLSVVGIMLFYHTLRRWLSVERALLATVLFLIEPYRVHDSFWLLSTPLFVLALLFAWWAWSAAVERGRIRMLLPCGFLLGAAILIRPLAVGIPVLLAPGVWWLFRKGNDPRLDVPATTVCEGVSTNSRPTPGGHRPWLSAFILVASILVGPTAWAIRNYMAAGRLSLTHQGGIVLAYFKATEVELYRQGRSADRYLETSLSTGRISEPHPIWEDIDERLRERYAHASQDDRQSLNWRRLAQGNRTNFDPFEVSDTLSDIGLSMLTACPDSTIFKGLIGIGEILTFPLTLAILPPNGVTVNGLQAGMMGVVYLAFTIAVVARLLYRRPDWTLAFFPLAASLALLIASTPQIDPRFRVPILPFLVALWLLPIAPKQDKRHEPGINQTPLASTPKAA